MLRKFVTTLTILILVIGTVLPLQAYSDADIGYEGRICRDLGILKGDAGVVDNAYLETHPSRLQAAIMFLRLKGLEQDALSYTGGSNFKDANAIAWKEGRNVLSYLKNHPEYGWIGDGINFLPYNPISSKEYYKVLLESLGYKQKIDGAGDFDWSSVLDFASEKGLKKVADTKNFTVRNLAIATVEALNSKMKNSDKKLIEHLVDNGDVNKGDAIDLDLYSKEMEAAVKTVRAISNSKVEVVFEELVDGSEAADEDLYSIKQLDIKEVSMKNAGAVIIDTSAMNESTTYTMVFNDKSYSFKGLRKDSYAPKLITAECKDTDLVELTFDRVLDNEAAQDSDTYSIEGATVQSAALDSTNTKVKLVTSGIQAGRSYELKIHSIKNGDGVTTKLITKRFTGKKDTSAPKLNKLTVLNNIKLLLEFSDTNGLDKETAQEKDNYRITQGGGSLDVEAVQVKDRDEDGLWDSVELVTESQEPGKAYTLIIEGISDGSVLRNKIAREIKKEFRGKSKDRTAPSVAHNPKAVTDTMVEIEFEDANALDIQSAYDMDNYDIDEDLEIKEIRIKNPNELYSSEGRTVLLITSEMEKSESYTLVIRGIIDEFGNEMKTSSSSGYKTYRFKGVADDRTPPYITSVECIDSKTIELNFDNVLEEESAENTTNYRIDSLALTTKAVLQEDGKTVRLTVSSLSSDKSHTVLLNNIKDLSGNALSNVSVSVLYNGNLYDDDPPEVAYIDAVNEKEVWIHFEEEVYAENARMEASNIDFEQAGSVLDDGTTVVMIADESMDDDEEYEVTRLTGVWDLRNNAYELESSLDFFGTDIENEPPEVDYWDQMDVRRFRVVFTEPVLLIKEGVSGIDKPSGVSIDWKAVKNPDEEDTNEAYSTVDYEANKDIPADKEFKFNFTAMVSDYVELGAYDEDDDNGDSNSTILESFMEDDEEPYIEYVEAITRNKAQIVFSEAIRAAGSYDITYEDDDNRVKHIDIGIVEIDSKDKTRVNIFTEDEMSDEYIYILEPQSAAADIAGNRLDIDDLEIEFAGTNIMSSDFIQGVEILNEDTLKVSKSSTIYKINSLYELDEDGDSLGGNLIESTSRVSDNVHKIISKKPLLRDVRYEITVDGLEYKFYGGVRI
ncbi:MAG TPA: Ig-like domain-containing protein [Clostridia bacterium]|nr:Ig-like domain-containing protein [Clostridia bacterium]